MIRTAVISLFFLTFFFPQTSCAEEVWQATNLGISDIDIRSISVFLGNDNFICASGANSVYLSEDGGNFWREIFSLKTEGEEVNFVTFDFSDPKILYLATTKGLFTTKNQGQDWRRIFRSVSEAGKNVGWIALDSLECQKIYIGTEAGLYVSSDLGVTWSKVGGGLPYSQVRSIAVHPSNSQVLYLANTYGIFKSIDSSQSWKRIYVTSYKVNDDENEEESLQISENQNLINCIAIDKRNSKRIFIATGQGVFVSPDAGETWNKLPVQGLSSDYVNFIVVAVAKKDVVYAATKNGVFEFLPAFNRWQEIYQGMTARDVRSLASNKDGKQLFAGTDRGVFRTIDIDIENIQKQKEDKVDLVRNKSPEAATPSATGTSNEFEIDRKNEMNYEQKLRELSLKEPTIRQVQEAALRYAEVVHPDKIKALRLSARLKALLPDISLDYDKTIYAGSTGRKDAFVGPRDWGFSLSWDVGDLVFSEQIRLIDSNARLLVQLRDDILNEVTRLYYERRKLQTELILMPPKSPKEYLTRTLRLEELTANIDALTGGYFSRHLKSQPRELGSTR